MSGSPELDSKSGAGSTAHTKLDSPTESGSTNESFFRKFSLSSSRTSVQHPPAPTPWQTRWLRLGPLSGIFCICLACCSLLASLAILVASDHSSTRQWTYQPSTYLAICTAFANQSMRYAAVQGIIIAWWTKALRGSTLAGLHQAWHAGFTVRGAIMAGRDMGMLGLATIFSTIVAIDGPLLQRASTVVSAPIVNTRVPLNVSITPEIPTNWTGEWAVTFAPVSATWNATMPSSTGPTPNTIEPGIGGSAFASVASQWLTGSPMSGYIEGCSGTCTAKVQAPAVSVHSCLTKSVPLTFFSPWVSSKATGVSIAAPLGQMGLSITASVLPEDHEKINLITGYASVKNCTGIFTYRACTLESAIGEYDVTIIDNGDVKINGPPTILAIANNTKITNRDPGIDHPSTLGGIVGAVIEKWYTNCYFWDASYKPSQPGVHTQTFGPYCLAYVDPVLDGSCPSYVNPQDDVLANINELMFRTGAAASVHHGWQVDGQPRSGSLDPGLSINSSVRGSVEGTHTVFHTDFNYFIAAAIVELVCIAFVLPTYWGFWKLGRSVSLSPVETAKAFEAPILRDCHSNSTGSDIVRTVGTTRISYGVTGVGAGAEGSERLALSRASISPTAGTKFEA